jgi:hypothetical protein
MNKELHRYAQENTCQYAAGLTRTYNALFIHARRLLEISVKHAQTAMSIIGQMASAQKPALYHDYSWF